MENQNDKTTAKKNMWLGVVITQCICVAIILISLVIMKYFFSDTFGHIKEWYKINICNDTSVNEVLILGGDNDEI